MWGTWAPSWPENYVLCAAVERHWHSQMSHLCTGNKHTVEEMEASLCTVGSLSADLSVP